MAGAKTVTTTEAAALLDITVQTFRERAKKAGLIQAGTRKGEGRGRPIFLWVTSEVMGLR